MWSVSGEPPVPSSHQLFSSTEDAAIYVYQDQNPKVPPIPGEPNPKKRTLYEIDMDTLSMHEIPIPVIIFQDKGFKPFMPKRR
jgi:hypothetical protein